MMPLKLNIFVNKQTFGAYLSSEAYDCLVGMFRLAFDITRLYNHFCNQKQK